MVQKERNPREHIQSISHQGSPKSRMEKWNHEYMAQGGMEKIFTSASKIQNV
jgi:hypothetical protein